MVHALQQVHRVLKPDGILVDLRPAPAHRRLGIGEGRSWRFVGELHEVLDDDYAANAAVDRVIRAGLFRKEKRMRFQLDRVMDTLQDVRDFIEEFDERRNLPPHTRLLERLERRWRRLPEPDKFAVRGPMHLAVLRKLEPLPERSGIGESMLLAILADASKAESLLNNLSEAEFDLNDVSVIMQDIVLKDKIAKDVGPLRGTHPSKLHDALHQVGVSHDHAQRCADAVKAGKVVVAMKADPKYAPAAREMFTDISAEIVEG